MAIAMDTLDYQTPPARSSAGPSLLGLVALPVVAQAAALVCALHSGSGPLNALSVRDALILAGPPAAIPLAALAWWSIARRRRLSLPAVLLGLGWFGLMLAWAIGSLVPLLRRAVVWGMDAVTRYDRAGYHGIGTPLPWHAPPARASTAV